MRKEQYVLAEIERLVPDLTGFEQLWDCPVPGGCSLKRPDKLYALKDRYLQLEIDEQGHGSYGCADEDTRLEIIAADVQLAGLVLRIDCDNPACFYRRVLPSGEMALGKRSVFDILCLRAALG